MLLLDFENMTFVLEIWNFAERFKTTYMTCGMKIKEFEGYCKSKLVILETISLMLLPISLLYFWQKRV